MSTKNQTPWKQLDQDDPEYLMNHNNYYNRYYKIKVKNSDATFSPSMSEWFFHSSNHIASVTMTSKLRLGARCLDSQQNMLQHLLPGACMHGCSLHSNVPHHNDISNLTSSRLCSTLPLSIESTFTALPHIVNSLSPSLHTWTLPPV